MDKSKRDISIPSIIRSASALALAGGFAALASAIPGWAQANATQQISRPPEAPLEPQPAQATPTPKGPEANTTTIKVCADPNNLPQSDKNGAGYENKLVEALGRDLGRRIEYTFFPQRMGFIRHTLKAQDETTGEFKCDLIVGVPKGYEMAATTQAYMHSTYALLVPKGAKLGALADPNDLLKLPAARLQSLRIGIFAKSPATDWLLKHGLIDRAVSYPAQSGDPNEHPASIIERDLANGKLDVAVVWGPVAGFLASRHQGQQGWTAVPFKPDPEIRFDYEIAMGVRYPDKEWKAMLDQWIAGHHAEIDKLLQRYQVPLLAIDGAAH
jgi:quinoprotein dehydrogenase-associated probable ABC transporter substrate-binding protein